MGMSRQGQPLDYLPEAAEVVVTDEERASVTQYHPLQREFLDSSLAFEPSWLFPASTATAELSTIGAWATSVWTPPFQQDDGTRPRSQILQPTLPDTAEQLPNHQPHRPVAPRAQMFTKRRRTTATTTSDLATDDSNDPGRVSQGESTAQFIHSQKETADILSTSAPPAQPNPEVVRKSRQTAHYKVERRYRNNLNDKILALGRAMNLPDLTSESFKDGSGHNKGLILSRSLEHIQELRSACDQKDREIAQLMQALRAIKDITDGQAI